MYIAMVGHKRVPSREGGVEVVVEEIGSRMVLNGHEVTCYNRRGTHVSGKEFALPSVRVYRGIHLKTVPTIDKKGLAAVTASFFAAIFAAFGKYDIVHFHAEGSCIWLWIPKLFGKRCIVTIHGLDHQRGKWRALAKKTILAGEKCAVKCADEIIVLSEDMQNYFTEQYHRKTRFIPNGVNRAQKVEAREIAQQFGLQKGTYILFLGRIVPEKGLKYLINAYKQVNTDRKLVIAGGSSDTGEFFQELEQLAKDDERILFTGFVQGRMLEELYSNAYIYILPSDLEGMPLSLMEAMSYGNCCLTSDIRECADVVGEKGVLFQHGQVNDLKQKMQMLCDKEEVVNRYRAEAAEYICERYDWGKIVNETLQVYAGA